MFVSNIDVSLSLPSCLSKINKHIFKEIKKEKEVEEWMSCGPS